MMMMIMMLTITTTLIIINVKTNRQLRSIAWDLIPFWPFEQVRVKPN